MTTAAINVLPSHPEFMTAREYAARLRVSERQVRRWIAEHMPALRCGPQSVRVRVEEADRWLQEREAARRGAGGA